MTNTTDRKGKTLTAEQAREKMIVRQSGKRDLGLNRHSGDKSINARNLPHGDSLGWPKGDYRRQ